MVDAVIVSITIRETSISYVRDGTPHTSELVPAGAELAQSLVQYLKNERNLLINRLSAEHYILRATSIYGEGESKIIPIKGLNLLTESPGIINLAKVDMENALYPILDGIITTISKQITYTFIGSDSIEKLVVLERNLAPVLLWSDRLASQLGSSYKILLKAAE